LLQNEKPESGTCSVIDGIMRCVVATDAARPKFDLGAFYLLLENFDHHPGHTNLGSERAGAGASRSALASGRPAKCSGLHFRVSEATQAYLE
jgi:hypothetical protein